MTNPVAITRSTFFTNTEEARKSGSVPKSKPPFDPILRFVQVQHLFRILMGGRHIRRHDKVGLPPGLRLQGRFQHLDGPVYLPDLVWCRVRTWASASSMPGAALHLERDFQPRWRTFP